MNRHQSLRLRRFHPRRRLMPQSQSVPMNGLIPRRSYPLRLSRRRPLLLLSRLFHLPNPSRRLMSLRLSLHLMLHRPHLRNQRRRLATARADGGVEAAGAIV